MRGIALTAAALLVLEAGSGCSSVKPSAIPAAGNPAPAPGLVPTYSAGRASRTFSSSTTEILPAVVAALQDLQIEGVHRINDGSLIVVEGTTSDKRRASITIRPQNPSSTRLTARVGLFGDEPLSKALIERVGIRLGELPPAPIPAEIPSAPAPNPFLDFLRSAGPDPEMLKDMADSRFRDSVVP
jgi:hypothetical protein